MAICDPITAPLQNEPFRVPDSAVSRAFLRLLATSALWLEAERDLAGMIWCDPAFDGWLRDAEVARAEVLHAVDGVRECGGWGPGEAAMRRMATMFRGLMLAEDPAEFYGQLDFLARNARGFSCAGDDPASRRAARMLAAARDRIAVMAAMLVAEHGEMPGMVPAAGSSPADPAPIAA